MRKIFFLLFLPLPLMALLPPYWQSSKEITTILSSPQLEENLGESSTIQSITKNERGYLIKNMKYQVQANIHYVHNQTKIGPADFTIEIESAKTIP